jgi:hypothetical protein
MVVVIVVAMTVIVIAVFAVALAAAAAHLAMPASSFATVAHVLGEALRRGETADWSAHDWRGHGGCYGNRDGESRKYGGADKGIPHGVVLSGELFFCL